jgi:hypothetical protein
MSPSNTQEQHQEEKAFIPHPSFTPNPSPTSRPIPTPNLSLEKYQKSISSEGGELQPPRFKPLPK